jgi:hypothetical protein
MAPAATLKSEPPSPKESAELQEPWRGVCSSRCYFAESDKKRCKCRCKGDHHGKGKPGRREGKAIEDFF